jgi:hypothetical protein
MCPEHWFIAALLRALLRLHDATGISLRQSNNSLLIVSFRVRGKQSIHSNHQTHILFNFLIILSVSIVMAN